MIKNKSEWGNCLRCGKEITDNNFGDSITAEEVIVCDSCAEKHRLSIIAELNKFRQSKGFSDRLALKQKILWASESLGNIFDNGDKSCMESVSDYDNYNAFELQVILLDILQTTLENYIFPEGLDFISTDRTITIRIPKISKKEYDKEPNFLEPIWKEIRDELYILGLKYPEVVAETYETITSDKIRGRLFFIIKPELTIAKLISEELYQDLENFWGEEIEQRQSIDFETDWEFLAYKQIYKLLSPLSPNTLLSPNTPLSPFEFKLFEDVVKDLKRMLMMCRNKRHFIIINMTYFNEFGNYIVWQRPLSMIHLYSRNEIQPGRFIYIKKKNLERLYSDWRTKKKRNYKIYGSRKCRGTFPDILNPDYKHNVLNEFNFDAYEKNKNEAIASIGKETKKINEKELRRDICKDLMIKLNSIGVKLKQEQYSQIFGITTRSIKNYAKENREREWERRKEDNNMGLEEKNFENLPLQALKDPNLGTSIGNKGIDNEQ